MTSSSSWEGWATSWDDSAQRPSFDPDDEIPYDEYSPEQAGHEFASMLVDMKRCGTITAKSACILAFWAVQAGATGFAGKFALAPEKHTGYYSKRFDEVVGVLRAMRISIRCLHRSRTNSTPLEE